MPTLGASIVGLASRMSSDDPRHSMPRFTEKRLRTYLHPYPELQSKAHNVLCLQVVGFS